MNDDAIHSAAGELHLRRRPVLWRPVTAVCWGLAFLGALLMILAQFGTDPLDYLDDPVRAVLHVGDRSLDLSEAVRHAPEWEQTIYAVLGYTPDDLARQVRDAYHRASTYVEHDEFARAFDSDVYDLRVREAVLVAEMDEWNGAEELLADMPEAVQTDAFVSAMRLAYGDSAAADGDVPRPSDLSVLGVRTNGSWVYDTLAMRIAEQSDSAAAAEFQSRILDRGRRALNRGRVLEVVYAAFIIAGIVVLLRSRSLFQRGYEIADGLSVAPWPMRYGLDVLVRFLVFGAALLFLVIAVTRTPYGLYSLLGGLPMLILSQHYLFKPDGLNLPKAVGLGLEGISPKTLVLFTLALIAVDQGGALLLTAAAEAIGLGVRLEEGIEETVLFGHPLKVAVVAFDGIVAAPLMEEIGFRGLLYMTLRSRFRPLPAACMSGAFFGFLHMYSLIGLLVIFWTGFVLALAYERCRSLWPCILAHAFNNMIYFADLLLLYR